VLQVIALVECLTPGVYGVLAVNLVSDHHGLFFESGKLSILKVIGKSLVQHQTDLV